MGLFSRRSDPEGFYTGDAPASVPGMDGAAPSAYQSQPATASPAPVDPGYGSAGPNYPPPPSPVSGYRAPPPPTPAQRPPMVFQQVVSTATPRRSRMGGWIVFAIVLAVLIPVGFTVYHAFTGLKDAVGKPSDPPAAAVGKLGVPVTVPYRYAELKVTVKSAVAQPVDGWSSGERVPDPKLVVGVTVTRTDADTGKTSVMAWDWHFQPAEGPAVEGELITSYQPELESTPIGTGQSISGLITFDTGADAGTLTVNDPYTGDHPAARWDIVGSVPKVVTGTVGRPATGQIAGPGFTVTPAKPQWLKAGDDRLRDTPKSGSVLRMSSPSPGCATNMPDRSRRPISGSPPVVASRSRPRTQGGSATPRCSSRSPTPSRRR